MKYHNKCRICGSEDLVDIVNLGNQALSSVFPKEEESDPTKSPLELIKCQSCKFVQLRHSADLEEMYGTTYGYYSGLSKSMVKHLNFKAEELLKLVDPPLNANILDIGCNDGTLLNHYLGPANRSDLNAYGVDPSSEKFKNFINPKVNVFYEFFGSEFINKFHDKKFHIITSIAMFYDLDDPKDFVKTIASCLSIDGVWSLELSYLPLFLKQLSYDQLCHEHVGYYNLEDLKNLFLSFDLSIFEVNLNDMNGGSIYLKVCHKKSISKYSNPKNQNLINKLLLSEKIMEEENSIGKLKNRLINHKYEIRNCLNMIKSSGKKVLGYGASTKGNILLHYCEITKEDIEFIGDLNPEKHTRFTPGTRISIKSHDQIKKMKPDYLFVLIWHFRKEIIELEEEYINNGGKLIFPLPRLHIVDNSNYKFYLKSDFDDLAFS